MAPSIPDRWLNYSPIGRRVQGTRFIAFKVPLQQHINDRVEKHLRLAPESLLESVPNLGLIIDLTNTNRYYSPSAFTDNNVEHQKLMIPGKMTPSAQLSARFCEYVSDFLKTNKNNDKLIGVHCTHGVNRTGYMICYFMINVLKMLPMEAIHTFAAARGHEIERNNYTQSLRQMENGQNPVDDSEPEPIVNWRQRAKQRMDEEISQTRGCSNSFNRNTNTSNDRYNNSRDSNNYNSRFNRNNAARNYGNNVSSHSRSYGRNYGNCDFRQYGNSYSNDGGNSNNRYNNNSYSNDGGNSNNRYNSNNYGNNKGNYGNRYNSNNYSSRYNSNRSNDSRTYGNNSNKNYNDRYEYEEYDNSNYRNSIPNSSGSRYRQSPYQSHFIN